MSNTISAKFDNDETAALKDIADSGEAENISEALRMTCREGLAKRGYAAGECRNTYLRKAIRRGADATALLGILWIGLTFFFPVVLRAFAIPIFMIAVTLYSADRVLAQAEPGVSDWLKGFLGGEPA